MPAHAHTNTHYRGRAAPHLADELVDLADLGLADASLNDLRAACAFAGRPDSDLHNLPFAVSSDDLLTALVSTTTIPVASPRQS